MSRGALRTVVLGVVGLALAVAVGLAANAISRDSIGLAPTPAGSAVRLAPPRTTSTATESPAAPARNQKKTTTAKPTARKPATPTTTSPTAPTPTTPTTTSGGDDRGGNSGKGGGDDSDNSGKGGGGGDDD